MALPNPLPDNPQKWEGWRAYISPNYYERLGLSFDSNASADQIEENCRILLVWWQKKLPLKNQPSNPLSQILRAGLDEAPTYLVEARAALLDPESRRVHDDKLRNEAIEHAIEEFTKLITFSLSDHKLMPEDEQRLITAGMNMGLNRDETLAAIEARLAATGSVRFQPPAPVPAAPVPVVPEPAPQPVRARRVDDSSSQKDPFSEFRRILHMSRLCLDGEDMTDDQRDAMCNLGESLGLTGGQAEDLIDEYLEEVAVMPAQSTPRAVAVTRPAPAPAAVASKPAPVAAAPAAAPATPRNPFPVITPLMRAQEREKYPNFRNSLAGEMFLIPTGSFTMGSNAPGSLANEQPLTLTHITRFFMSRFPITNVQYERFDPSHAAKRAPWADDQHPAVYVSANDAEKFCEWLSRTERRKYRLPTEAEWEYAARGMETRIFPWGDLLNGGNYANFADARTSFAWREAHIDDGWPQTSPVGSYPRGASPFGIEDLAGNVFEWCLDGMESYKGKETANPRSSRSSNQRIYRGGSWKSRITSLRTTARSFNQPDYSSNDVGFRVICECD